MSGAISASQTKLFLPQTGWAQQGHCYLTSETPSPGMEVNPDKSQLQLLQGTVTLELAALKKTLIKAASRMPLH